MATGSLLFFGIRCKSSIKKAATEIVTALWKQTEINCRKIILFGNTLRKFPEITTLYPLRL